MKSSLLMWVYYILAYAALYYIDKETRERYGTAQGRSGYGGTFCSVCREMGGRVDYMADQCALRYLHHASPSTSSQVYTAPE